MNVDVPGYIAAALKNPENGRVFAEVMGKSQTLTEEEKYRYSGEGFNFLLAGTETTAVSPYSVPLYPHYQSSLTTPITQAILTVFTYHMLDNPSIYTHLTQSLSEHNIDPQNLKWLDLEKIPYLWAILHECLRMMPGVSHRSARIAREEDLHYRSADGKADWVIPRGTPIGMTSMINHWDTTLFPDPDEFVPERWLLEDGRSNVQLEKKLIAFGKGSRVCIGEK